MSEEGEEAPLLELSATMDLQASMRATLSFRRDGLHVRCPLGEILIPFERLTGFFEDRGGAITQNMSGTTLRFFVFDIEARRQFLEILRRESPPARNAGLS